MREEYVEFPECYSRYRLRNLYKGIPPSADVVKLLRTYFCAMSNLYGSIPLKKAYEIINEQNPDLISREEFIAFAKVAIHELDDYFIMGQDEIFTNIDPLPFMEREIISVYILNDDISVYDDLLQSHFQKPYYIPEREILLKYKKREYTELNPETNAMKAFLKKIFTNKPEKIKGFFDRMILRIRSSSNPINNLQVVFDDPDFVLEEEDIGVFVELYYKLSNNTRIPFNKGYTPNEMASILPAKPLQSITLGPNIKKAIMNGSITVHEYKDYIQGISFPSEELKEDLLKELDLFSNENVSMRSRQHKKVGRNEPCPCGSGKKYKKCCGR